MPVPTWIETEGPCRAATDTGETFVERLAAAGVLGEVEAIWDAEDAGVSPCEVEHVEDVLDEVQRRRSA